VRSIFIFILTKGVRSIINIVFLTLSLTFIIFIVQNACEFYTLEIGLT